MRAKVCLLFFMLLSTNVPALSGPLEPRATKPGTAAVALLEDEDGAEAYQGLAESMLIERNYGEAKKLALRALEARPDSVEARVVLAKVSLATGELREAQTYASELLQNDPGDPDYHALQGMVYMLDGQAEQAIPFIEKALELGQSERSSTQMASYANTLVLAYHQNAQADLALASCLRFLEEYPEEIDLYLSCSRLYREKKDYSAALDIAEKGLAIDPNFPGLYGSVALARMGLGQPELAEAAYRQLQLLNPELAQMLRETLDGQRKDEVEVQVRVE